MTDTLMPSRLWKQMTATQRLAAARAFWADEDAVDDQVQAAMLIAQQKRFRPKTVVGLDLDRKSRHLASLASLPDAIAARVLVLHHLTAQRPMMGRFLDALGIAHEDGLIKDENVVPAQEKLAPAAAAIAQEFPADDVRLYLTTLICQDPETWSGLESVVAGLAPAVPVQA
ncbi:MAG: hypothetical protein ABUS56_13560 [Acidobacteriota bacterium]